MKTNKKNTKTKNQIKKRKNEKVKKNKYGLRELNV